MSSILILGIDPGLNKCGWGVVASEGARIGLDHAMRDVAQPRAILAARLCELFDQLTEMIARERPHEVAVEETFVNSNARAALALGQARARWN